MAEMTKDEQKTPNSAVLVLTINEVSEPKLEPIYGMFFGSKMYKNGTDLRLFGCERDIFNRKTKSVPFGCNLSEK